MNKNNTFEVTYTDQHTGDVKVRHRAARDSMSESYLMDNLIEIFEKAGGRDKSPYDFRYTDYKL